MTANNLTQIQSGRRTRRDWTGVVVFAVALGAASSARAVFWSASSPGNLLTGSNWQGGVAPNGEGDVAEFFTQPTTDGDFTLNDNWTLGTLRYSGHERDIRGLGRLTLDNGDDPALVVLGGDLGIRVPVTLAGDVEFSQPGGAYNWISGRVSGSGHVTKTGDGYLWLYDETNNYTSVNEIRDGWLVGESIADRGVNSAFGRGDFELHGRANLSGLIYAGPSASTNRVIELNRRDGWTRDISTIIVQDPSTSLTWNGPIEGEGDLAVWGYSQEDGAGAFVLAGQNSYTGATFVHGTATLRLGGHERIPQGSDTNVQPSEYSLEE